MILYYYTGLKSKYYCYVVLKATRHNSLNALCSIVGKPENRNGLLTISCTDSILLT